MSNEAQGALPVVPFSMNELRAINHVVWAYSRYIRNFASSDQEKQLVRTLEQIHRQLAEQLAEGEVKEVRLLLSVEELEALLTSMMNFVHLVTRFFPPNEGRQAVTEAVNVWRLRLIAIIAQYKA